MSRKSHRRMSPMADINITNLVDVTMVLLIIFIIVAPFLKQGLTIRLPQVVGPKVELKAITIEVDDKGTMMLDGEPVDMESLVPRLNVLAEEYAKKDLAQGNIQLPAEADPESYKKKTRPVHIKGDEGVTLGEASKIFSRVQEAGYEKCTLLTQPPSRG